MAALSAPIAWLRSASASAWQKSVRAIWSVGTGFATRMRTRRTASHRKRGHHVVRTVGYDPYGSGLFWRRTWFCLECNETWPEK